MESNMNSKGRGKEGTGETLRRRIDELESRVAELEAKQKRNKKVEKQMAVENAVTRILAESSSPSQVIPRILQSVCESLEWELGDFWCLYRSGNLLYYKDLWH